jgi:hypothetical protein
MFTLPDDVMKDVDAVIRRRLGLSDMNCAIQDEIDYLDKKISYFENDLEHVKDVACEYIQKATSVNAQKYTKIMKKEEEKKSKNISEMPSINNSKDEKVKSQKRIEWTFDLCVTFLDEYTHMDKQEMAKKYGCKTLNQLYAKKQYANTLINKHHEMDDSKDN